MNNKLKKALEIIFEPGSLIRLVNERDEREISKIKEQFPQGAPGWVTITKAEESGNRAILALFAEVARLGAYGYLGWKGAELFAKTYEKIGFLQELPNFYIGP